MQSSKIEAKIAPNDEVGVGSAPSSVRLNVREQYANRMSRCAKLDMYQGTKFEVRDDAVTLCSEI